VALEFIRPGCAPGTFLLTTSNDDNGYYPAENTYYAKPGNTPEMKHALEAYVGTRKENPTEPSSNWNEIASAHIALYKTLLNARR
jgi:ABC-type glycerol-3-phosphate transport system substrate-binding protein